MCTAKTTGQMPCKWSAGWRHSSGEGRRGRVSWKRVCTSIAVAAVAVGAATAHGEGQGLGTVVKVLTNWLLFFG